jgi:hypothetical protein
LVDHLLQSFPPPNSEQFADVLVRVRPPENSESVGVSAEFEETVTFRTTETGERVDSIRLTQDLGLTNSRQRYTFLAFDLFGFLRTGSVFDPGEFLGSERFLDSGLHVDLELLESVVRESLHHTVSDVERDLSNGETGTGDVEGRVGTEETFSGVERRLTSVHVGSRKSLGDGPRREDD